MLINKWRGGWGACLVGVFGARLSSFFASKAPAILNGEPDWLTKTSNELHATFKNLTFEEVRPSEIPGVVEIYAGPRILYYAPAQKILIFGELYNSAGNSLTDAKLQAYVGKR